MPNRKSPFAFNPYPNSPYKVPTRTRILRWLGVLPALLMLGGIVYLIRGAG